jgi:hypothetical protein
VVVAALSRSDWIALGAVLIAGGALILAIFALVLAWRVDAQVRQSNGEATTPEGRADARHDVAQTAVIETAVADNAVTEVVAAPELARAELRLVAGLAVPDGSDRRRYAVTVHNVGGGRADDVRVTVEDEDGETVSTPSSQPPLSLAGGESGHTAAWVPRSIARPGLTFAVSWRDDGDRHAKTEVALPY